MLLQNLVEFLYRAVVIKVVEVIEGAAVQRVTGTVRQTCCGSGDFGVSLHSRYRDRNGEKQYAEHQAGIGEGAEIQISDPLVRELSLPDGWERPGTKSITSPQYLSANRILLARIIGQ